jgi:hypothetical protein
MPTTPAKRQKEKNRQDKQKEKDARRDQRKRENANKGPRIAGHDPDIDGIVPGPQPLPEEFLY